MRTAENRRAPRDMVSFRTSLKGADGARSQALIVDISPLGLMARTPAVFAQGDCVTITLPVVGPRTARVAWALVGRVGTEFEVPIAAAAYARLLAAAPHDPPRWDGF